METTPTCLTCTPTQGYHLKGWNAEQTLYDASNCNTPCGDNNDQYYHILHELNKDFNPHVDISITYLWFQDDAKSQSTKTIPRSYKTIASF